MSAEDSNANLFIIVDTSTSAEQRRQNRWTARSHVSKKNRRPKQGDQKLTQGVALSFLAPRSRNNPRHEEGQGAGQQDARVVAASGWHTRRISAPGKYREQGQFALRYDDSVSWIEFPLRRTPSPVFGALPPDAFGSQNAVSVAPIANNLFNTLCPLALSARETDSLFETFCTRPILFHGLAYTHFLALENIRGSLTPYDEREKLTHLSKARELTNRMIHSHDKDDIEAVLWNMTVMLDSSQSKFARTTRAHVLPSLFLPHMPWAEAIQLSMVGLPEGYSQATQQLVLRVGGFDKLTRPALARMIAHSDLLNCGLLNLKPFFPCYWDVTPEVLIHMRLWQPTARCPVPGAGFLSLIPGGLPSEAVSVLSGMAVVDVAMALCKGRWLHYEEQSKLIGARNMIYHRLLSLPKWQGFDESQKGTTHAALYDCCLLTAQIYANGVIRQTVPNAPGILEPLQQLNDKLETSRMLSWDEDISAIVVWFLVVGSIAAYRTRHRDEFLRKLRNALSRAHTSLETTPVESVRKMLYQFIWSDEAGEQGLLAVLEALGLDLATSDELP